MEPHDNNSPPTPRPADMRALDRLLDQQELANGPADHELRALRRLCGRWLMLRRLRRGLGLEELALRVGVAPELLHLIELGLVDSPLVAVEAWHRLSLVLEGAELDFTRVAAALQLALGAAHPPDPAWIDQLVAELAQDPEAANEPTSDPELLQAADLLVQQASRGKLPRHNVLVLQVLHRAFEQPLEGAEIKVRVEALGFSFEFTELFELLRKLQAAQLIDRNEGAQAGFRLTASGRRAFALALRGSAAQRELNDVLGALPNPL